MEQSGMGTVSKSRMGTEPLNCPWPSPGRMLGPAMSTELQTFLRKKLKTHMSGKSPDIGSGHY